MTSSPNIFFYVWVLDSRNCQGNDDQVVSVALPPMGVRAQVGKPRGAGLGETEQTEKIDYSWKRDLIYRSVLIKYRMFGIFSISIQNT